MSAARIGRILVAATSAGRERENLYPSLSRSLMHERTEENFFHHADMPPSSSPTKSVPGDTVTLGGKSVPGVAFGCGHDNEGPFVDAAGLLGLSDGALSFPNQVTSSPFSYCLVDRDSTSLTASESAGLGRLSARTQPFHMH